MALAHPCQPTTMLAEDRNHAIVCAHGCFEPQDESPRCKRAAGTVPGNVASVLTMERLGAG